MVSDLSVGFFQIKQELFHICTVGKAGQTAIGADDTVAGLDDHQGIAVVGLTDSTTGLGSTDGLCDLFVASRFSIRNLPQSLPDGLLKRCTFWGKGQIESFACASKVFFQLVLCFQQQRGRDVAVLVEIERFCTVKADERTVLLKEPERPNRRRDRDIIVFQGSDLQVSDGSIV